MTSLFEVLVYASFRHKIRHFHFSHLPVGDSAAPYSTFNSDHQITNIYIYTYYVAVKHSDS